MSVSFEGLYAGQKEAVCHSADKVLVLAGPGTGKTEVLTHRIFYLIKQLGASPREILAITFSRKAASEMRQRISGFAGIDTSEVRMSTLHAESLRMLHAIGQAPRFIVSESEARMLVQDAIDDENLSSVFKRVKECERWIKLRKAENKLPNDIVDQNPRNRLLTRIYGRYEELLRWNNAADLDGFVIKVSRILRTDSNAEASAITVRYLLIDEYQDINEGEYQLIKLLSRRCSKLFVVGDDDQSIYGWRGADPFIIRRFQTDFEDSQIVTLQDSARCTDHILRGAHAIVSKVPGYLSKNLRSARGTGSPIHILCSSSETREAYWIANRTRDWISEGSFTPRQMAVICKRLDLAEPVVARLQRMGIRSTYWRSRGFFSDKVVQEILAYLRILVDCRDNLALRTCLESRTGWGIGRVGINQLRRAAEAANTSLWDMMKSAQGHLGLARWATSFERFTRMLERLAVRSADLNLIEVIDLVARTMRAHRLRSVEILKNWAGRFPSDHSVNEFIEEVQRNRGLDLAGGAPEPEEDTDAVSIMSMHAAKGLTYEIVFVIGMEHGSFPDPKHDEAEQRRLMYVAMTRARKELFLCYAKRRIGPPARGFSFYRASNLLGDIPREHRDTIDNT